MTHSEIDIKLLEIKTRGSITPTEQLELIHEGNKLLDNVLRHMNIIFSGVERNRVRKLRKHK